MQAKALPVAFEVSQDEKLRAYLETLDFTSVTSISRNTVLNNIGMSCVRGMFIDNSLNGDTVIISVDGTGQKLTTPPYAQSMYPVLQIGGSFGITATSNGAKVVKVQLLNFSVSPSTWYVTAPGSIAGTINVSGSVEAYPLVSTYVDNSGNIAVGGTAQTLVALNASRKNLLIQNPYTAADQGIAAAEPLYISPVGAAVIGPPSLLLLPGGSFETSSAPISSQAWSVIAATTGHKFTAWEMS